MNRGDFCEFVKGIILHFKKLDWVLIISSVLLVGFGLLSLWSSSQGDGNFLNFQKQIIFWLVGIFLMLLISFFDWRALRENPYLILMLYILCLVSLVGLFFVAPEIRGVRSWYKIGQISIDPIEFTLLALIIILAKYFSNRHIEMYRVRHLILSGMYVLVPALLIFFQPNLGSFLLLVALWVGVLLFSGIKLRHFLILCLCGLIFFAFSWFFLLKDYQKERIASFFKPQLEPLGIGWSQNQAKIAIGSGGLLGKGWERGSQTRYGFLPEPQTDFIFSAIAEEFGLVGVFFLMLFFVILIGRIIKIAVSAESNFPRLFSAGLAIILVAKIIIHIGMNLGVLPIIGIPLPFVSYGGSSLVAAYIGLGVLQSIKTH